MTWAGLPGSSAGTLISCHPEAWQRDSRGQQGGDPPASPPPNAAGTRPGVSVPAFPAAGAVGWRWHCPNWHTLWQQLVEPSPDAAPREPRCHPATVASGEGMGRAVAAVSGFLHTASTCNSQEQSELFWSKDIASFLCSPGLTTGGWEGAPGFRNQPQLLQTPARPSLGPQGAGLDPSHHPDFCSWSGVTFSPTSPSTTPGAGGSRLAQRKQR